MFRFWLREIELTIDDRQWLKTHRGGLEITFEIKKKSNDDPNDTSPDLSTITITNLSKDSINSIKKGSKVTLNAGYEDHRGNLLGGEVASVETRREGLDNITEIKVTDGGKAWGVSTLNRTYQSNTKASYIINEVALYMGYEIGSIKPANNISYKLGKTISGKCSGTLKQLVKDTNSKMYINNNKIFVLPTNEGVKNGFEISVDSGLMVTPTKQEKDATSTEDSKASKEQKKEVSYEVLTRLNHELVINSIVRIKSNTISGDYRITEVTHSSSDFTSKLNVVEVR